MAMMRPAPAIAAPFTADRPMPPSPITATVSDPGSDSGCPEHCADLVVTAQPIMRSAGSGILGIFTTACSCTSMWSAKDESAAGLGMGNAVRFRAASPVVSASWTDAMATCVHSGNTQDVRCRIPIRR